MNWLDYANKTTALSGKWGYYNGWLCCKIWKWQWICRTQRLHDENTNGFSDYAIENLMKGKIVTTAYGKVKYNSKSGILTTFYPDGRIKEEVL